MGDLFGVGDWVFCEFALSHIKSVDGGRVTEVSDGACSHSSYDLSDRCMPLTMPMKRIADHWAWCSKEIHRKGSMGLNYPDIHRWLVESWVTACGHASDDTLLTADYARVSQFMLDVLSASKVESGYGFALLR